MKPAPVITQPVLDEASALRLFIEAMFRTAPDTDTTPVPPVTCTDTVAEAYAPPETGVPAGSVQQAALPFDVLVFRTGGFRLAAPLGSLCGILRWPESLSVLPGAVPWILGLLRHGGQNTRVVDLAAFLGAQAPGAEQTAGDRRVALFAEGRWGTVCELGFQTRRVSPGDLRHARGESSAPWLRAVLVDPMTYVLDMERLTAALERGESFV